jgi:glycosyltransferase involved in cell wall biosynthesis
MKNDPLVSIIIDNYNYERFVGEAIDSALAQTYGNIEVIVVDDGSTDDSRRVIAGYGERIKTIFKRNGGQGSAFNAGYRLSRGSIVSFLDSDDVHLPDAIGKAAAFFEDPQLAKVHWPLALINAEGAALGRNYPEGKLARGDLRDTVCRVGPTHFLHAPNSGNVWARWFLDALLPFPEELYRNGCDTLLFEAAPFFGKIARVDEPLTLYRQHGGNDAKSMSAEDKVRRELAFYDHYASLLQRQCVRRGVSPDTEEWRKRSWWHLHDRLLAHVASLPHPSDPVIVIDDATLELGPFAERPRLPFLERSGSYAGPPADDASAIEELERMRAGGAAVMVVAWMSFWWRDHFRDFFAHVEKKYRKLHEDDCCVTYDLR